MSREVDVKALISHIVRGDGADKCRICLGDTSEGQVYLGDTVMMDGERPVTLAELLEVITGVEMETSSQLPATVCQECVNTATVTAPFIQLCKNANQKWTEISNYLSKFGETVPSTAKSAFICINNDEIKVVDFKYRIINVKKALKVAKNTFLKTKVREKGIERSDLKCPECGKVYPNIYLFNLHLKDIDKKICFYCKQIVDINTFAKHLAIHGATLFTCDLCKSTFKARANFDRHKKLCRRKGNHKCVDCSQSFVNVANLIAHYASKHNPKVCAACNKKFVSKVCFKNHTEYCTESKMIGSKYICDYCSKVYTHKNALRLHIRFTHVVGWEYQCEQCGKKFSNPAHLREHGNKHNRVDDRYVCSICDAKYSTRRGYERHHKRHFDENGEVTKVIRPCRVKKRVLKFEKCVICSYITNNKKMLEKHLRVQHNILALELIRQ